MGIFGELLYFLQYSDQRTEASFDLGHDLVIVFDVDEKTGDVYEECRWAYEHIVTRIGRKYIYEFDSEFNERFLVIRISNSRLRRFAEFKGYCLLLHPDITAGALRVGDEHNAVGKVELIENMDVSPIYPTDYIYVKYRVENDDLFWKPAAASTPLAGVDRQILLWELMKAPETEGGNAVDLRSLAHQGYIKSYFPLHNYSEKEDLAQLWNGIALPWRLPLISIRHYFGDKICQLIGLSSHIATWLLVPGLVGIAFEVLQLHYDGWSRHETPVFAYFTALWMVVLCFQWAQKQHLLSIFCGFYSRQISLEERRPDHVGFSALSTVDGQEDVHYPTYLWRARVALTSLLSTIVVACIVGASSGHYYIRYLMIDTIVADVSGREQWIAAAITAVYILSSNPVLTYLAKYLTFIENHRTDGEIEKYFSIKLFVFKFVLVFATFYYIAFGASFIPLLGDVPYLKRIASCSHDDCMKDLSIILVAVVGLRSFWTFVFGYMSPSFLHASESHMNWRREQDRIAAETPSACSLLCERCCCSDGEEERGVRRGCFSCCCYGLRNSSLCVWCRRSCCSRPPTHRRQRRYEQSADVATGDNDAAPEGGDEKGGDKDIGYEMYDRQRKNNKSKYFDSEDDDEASSLLRSEVDVQYDKPSYSLLFDWNNDVCDRVLTLTLACMFTSALPAATALIALAEYFWLRGQSWKWQYKYKRCVHYSHSNGIGIWNTILSFCCVLVATTNAALVCFTMQNFSDWSATNTLLLFIAFHWSIGFVQYCLSMSSPQSAASNYSSGGGYDRDVEAIQRDRAKFIESKLIHKHSDDLVSPHSIL